MSPRLQDLHSSFGRHLRAEGCSDRTVAIYGQAMKFFSRWLQAQGREATLAELNRDAIRQWLAQLADDHEASTVKTRYRGLFRFCGWLVDEDELSENPMKTLSQPVPKMKPVPILSDQDLTLLLKACAGRAFIDRRDQATIRLLLDCGLRCPSSAGSRSKASTSTPA